VGSESNEQKSVQALASKKEQPSGNVTPLFYFFPFLFFQRKKKNQDPIKKTGNSNNSIPS
jgi:hypothetical protein